MFKKIASVVLTISLLFSCQQNPISSTKITASKAEVIRVSKVSEMPKKSRSVQAEVKPLIFIATVQYMNLEGGFFGLVSKEGKHWLPINLKKEFQQHGAVIKVKGNAIKGMMTIQQWGTPLSIIDIELIKPGRLGGGNNLH